MPVRNLLDDNNILSQEKNLVQKSESQKSLGVLKNIERFDQNSSENDNFDNGRI